MDPKNNDPKWENLGIVGFLLGALGYYAYNQGPASEEITFN